MKPRKSNFELLRIVSIVCIILYHAVWHSGINYPTMSVNRILIDFVDMLGQLGVNCFMLISGYFLLENKFKPVKVAKISLEASFYVLLGMGILQIFGDEVGVKWWLNKAFFPILNEAYWFLTVYTLVYLFSPILKKLILNLSKRQLEISLALSLFIWSVWPTIMGLFFTNDTEGYVFYNRLIWGILMFGIGSYIRIFPLQIFDKLKNTVITFLASTGLMILPILIVEFGNIHKINAVFFWRPNSILMLVWSVSLFLLFRKLEIKNSNWINKLAATTLGIYLLHDGSLRYFLWDKVFRIKDFSNSVYFIFYLLLVAVIIILAGFVIDTGRKFLEKVVLDKFFENASVQRLMEKINLDEEK